MKKTLVYFISHIIVLGFITNSYAGWLSEALKGKPPPLNSIVQVVVAPQTVLVTEAVKEEQRRKAIEEQNRILKERLATKHNEMNNLINNVNARTEAERKEIRSAHTQGLLCISNAISVSQADGCFVTVNDKILDIQRRNN